MLGKSLFEALRKSKDMVQRGHSLSTKKSTRKLLERCQSQNPHVSRLLNLLARLIDCLNTPQGP